jgi:hypothetical protein
MQIHLHCDLTLPTLVIGWNLFKTKFPHLKPNILTKEYGRIRWEFSMEERITDHFNGIANFMKVSPRQYVESYKYKNIDPVRDNLLDEDELIKHLIVFSNLFSSNAYQYKDEMIYLYSRTTFEITGLHLNAYRYFGFDTEKITNYIFDRVRQSSKNIATLDTDGLVYQSFYKQFPEFDQLKRSIVLFLS